MLYFGYELKITEKYKYVIFQKVKQSKLLITTWKLPSSKVYHGLNNALGIWVHEKHYQVLPTQMVPICENLGLGPWTICVTHAIYSPHGDWLSSKLYLVPMVRPPNVRCQWRYKLFTWLPESQCNKIDANGNNAQWLMRNIRMYKFIYQPQTEYRKHQHFVYQC